jgi:MFS family permease
MAAPARRRQWLSLGAGCAYMLLAGSLMAFSSFSRDLQALGYVDLPTLGATGHAGAYIGGIAMGAALDRLGSRRTAALSVALAAGGWLGFRYALLQPSGAPLALALAAIGLAGSTAYMSVSAACYALFHHRYAGRVHGLLLSAFSLSAVVWGPVYGLAFAGRGLAGGRAAAATGLTVTGLAGYAYVMAGCALVVGALTTAVIVDHTAVVAAQQAGAGRSGAAASAKRAGHSSGGGDDDDEDDAAPPAPRAPYEGDSLLALALPCCSRAITASRHRPLPQQTRQQSDEQPPPPSSDGDDGEQQSEGGSRGGSGSGVSPEDAAAAVNAAVAPGRHDEKAASLDDEPLQRLEPPWVGPAVLYAQFAASFCTLGGALLFVNNISLSLHAAVPLADDGAPWVAHTVWTAVLAFAAGNTLMRGAGGWAVDALHARGASRLAVYAAAVACLLAGLLTVLAAPVAGLLPAAALVGMADGACFAVWPVLVLDMYGRARYGAGFAIVNSALGFGSLTLGALASALYRARGSGATDAAGTATCRDVSGGCFAATWATAACLAAFVAAPCVGFLYWRELEEWRRSRTRRGGAAR